MKKFFTLLTFLIITTAMVFANERNEQQMRNAAMKVLSGKMTRSAKNFELKEFLTMEKLKIYGYEDGGFAVIAKDNRFDEVIGYSETHFSEEMPDGFKWWMSEMNRTVSGAF